MNKRILTFILVIVCCLFMVSCSKLSSDSTFSILFIDVGQGDSALVECDGHYMLIDGGKKSQGEKVRSVMVERGIQKLDYLVISHLHDDHYGGLIEILGYTQNIGKTLCNNDYCENNDFDDFLHKLRIDNSKITIPNTGDIFSLGSAQIEVVDSASVTENDSLVLMITYGENKFLFTGDIGRDAQTRLSDKYCNEDDSPYKIDLIKMPHHGGECSIRFIRTFMPTYAIISVGSNQYNHPTEETISRLEQADVKIYRTDEEGDIIVRSDGSELDIKTVK